MAEPIRVTALRGETVESRPPGARRRRSGRRGRRRRRAIRASSRSCARRRSRSRRCPLARAREDLDDRDLAIASRLAPRRRDAARGGRALLAKAPATEDDLECGPVRRARSSSTTARASTRGCSRSVAQAGRPRATGWPSIRASRRCSPRSPSCAETAEIPTGGRRLRRRHLRAAAGADGRRVRPHRRAGRRARCAPTRS